MYFIAAEIKTRLDGTGCEPTNGDVGNYATRGTRPVRQVFLSVVPV